MKSTLVNNGLPEGLHFKDIKRGDILEIELDTDAEGSHRLRCIVIAALDRTRRRSYKGVVTFRVMPEDDSRPVIIAGRHVKCRLFNAWTLPAVSDASVDNRWRQLTQLTQKPLSK